MERERLERNGVAMSGGGVPMKITKLMAAITLIAGAGLVAAQVPLTTFTAGDVIRADEVNENFESLADAVEAIESRPAATDGTVRVTPVDMAPDESATDYMRLSHKAELLLAGDSYTGGEMHCFDARVDLPEGAEVTSFGALLKAGDGADDTADAFLRERPWDSRPSDVLASVEATADEFREEATTSGLPVSVDPAGHAYVVTTCLQGRSGFLGARVSYEVP